MQTGAFLTERHKKKTAIEANRTVEAKRTLQKDLLLRGEDTVGVLVSMTSLVLIGVASLYDRTGNVR